MKKLILVLALLALICPFMGMKLYLTNTSSSGQTQSDPNASLGGYRSTTELSATSMKNLFDDVSVVEALLGDTEYRMIDVYNDGTGTAYGVQLYMQTATSSSSTELDFGYSSTNQPHADAWNGEALSNESTAPASPSMSFSNYTKTSPLSLGTIPASQSKRVCVRRTVTAGAPWTAHDLGRFGVRWGGVAASGDSAFCAGTELFCEDFEGTDTSWTETSTQLDCAAYDSVGDYCDDDDDAYEGAEALGMYSTGGNIYSAFTGSADEVTIDFWIKPISASTGLSLPLVRAASTSIVQMFTSSSGYPRIIAGGETLTGDTALTADEWNHIVVYIKKETANENNDGIVKLKLNGTEEISDTTNNCGVADMTGIRILSPAVSGRLVMYDNIKVLAGDQY